MMAIAAVVRTTPRCLMAINKSDQPTLNKRASQHPTSPSRPSRQHAPGSQVSSPGTIPSTATRPSASSPQTSDTSATRLGSSQSVPRSTSSPAAKTPTDGAARLGTGHRPPPSTSARCACARHQPSRSRFTDQHDNNLDAHRLACHRARCALLHAQRLEVLPRLPAQRAGHARRAQRVSLGATQLVLPRAARHGSNRLRVRCDFPRGISQ